MISGILFLGIALGFAGCSEQKVAQTECGAITVAEMNWASAEMLAHIDKVVLENGYGCEVELVPGSTMPTASSMMEKGEIPKTNQKYDGYTVCPLITSIGTVMLAEFNWASKKPGSGKNAALISFLDPTQERYIWWLLKVYLLKPMTQYGMLAGKA